MKFRQPLKITSRTSSVTNSFVQAIIPSIEPSPREREDALRALDMSSKEISCIYCGAAATDWDHLRPLVQGRLPSGYINEARNLVPSCGPCNQSKSGADWRTWMRGRARGSPKSKGVIDLEQRIARLERFEEWGCVEKLPLREFAGEESWIAYWAARDLILEKMVEAQRHAARLREVIQKVLDERGARKARSETM